MTKYYISFNGSGGNLAVEKHLHSYFREHFAGCTVTEDGIDMIVAQMKAVQDEYFKSHRGQAVEIRAYASGCDGNWFINMGGLYANLLHIRFEF